MEKIQNLSSKVENIRTPEECEKELIGFQLEYLEKVELDPTKRPKINNTKKEYSNDFSKILREHTSIENYLNDEYIKRLPDIKKEWGTSDFEYKRGLFVGDITNKIHELYLNNIGNWKSEAMELIDNEINRLGPVVNDLDKINSEKQNRCGLINFNVGPIGDPKNLEKLESLGLNSYDDYINIHFKDLYKQKLNGTYSGISDIKKSFSLLAEKIVDEYPQIKAVIGRSWLMDSKFGEMFKFEIFDRHENSVFTTGGFWGQFIDENGYIKKDKIRKFLDTGKAPFYPAEGIMKVEDFLDEYLPEERKRKGNIKLREISPESKKGKVEIDQTIKKVKDNWFKLSFEELFSMVESNPFLAEFYKTEDGRKHKELMREFKKSGISTMDDFVYDHREDINDKFNQYLNSYQYDYKDKDFYPKVSSVSR